VQAYIGRINAVNGQLRCVSDTSRFERALQAAKEVDEILARPDVDLHQLRRDQPFLGVPFTVKEAIKLKG
jgi:Asp-tRNA(Asn)/Glu-tRNA(Gln) amidotransferase A subunit family amidase